jgi:flagellar motor switch protein FliG
MSGQENTGVYLNGKKQVIELLKKMEGSDKATLLRNLKARNPILAKELAESCVNFDSIWSLDDNALRSVLSHVQPTILGLALHMTQVKNQRRALSLIERPQAMRAFEIMQKDLSSNRNECVRAQQKILEFAMKLHKNQIINLY